jgi:hypothetical protein
VSLEHPGERHIHRERTGTGLAEAKDAVERIARDHGLDRP